MIRLPDLPDLLRTSPSGWRECSEQPLFGKAAVRRHRPATLSPDAKRAHGRRGFTLIEVALVLAIVGVLLGGMLKGRGLLESARAHSLATEVEQLEHAWHAFRDRYGALPGDLAEARELLHADTPAGNGNGRLDNASERLAVWRHLSLAGLIGGVSGAGSPTGNECGSGSCPSNPFGGFFEFVDPRDGFGGASSGAILSTGDGVPAPALAALDRQLDDGRADTGRVQVAPSSRSACVRSGRWAPDLDVRCRARLAL